MPKLSNAKIKYIECELYDYEDTYMLAAQIKADISALSCETDYSQPRSGLTYKINQPTENAAIELITNKQLKKAVETINSIDKAVKCLSPEEHTLYRMKYISRLDWKDIVTRMCISDATFFRIRKKIVYAVAHEMGLI